MFLHTNYADSGIIDHHIDPAVGGDRRLDAAAAGVGRTEIEGDLGPGNGEALEALLVPGHHREAGTSVVQLVDQGRPDTSAGSGEEHGGVGEHGLGWSG